MSTIDSLAQSGAQPEAKAAVQEAGAWANSTMRGIADGVDEPVPSTIEDPAVLDALRPVLSGEL